jgi:hypothetical protein
MATAPPTLPVIQWPTDDKEVVALGVTAPWNILMNMTQWRSAVGRAFEFYKQKEEQLTESKTPFISVIGKVDDTKETAINYSRKHAIADVLRSKYENFVRDKQVCDTLNVLVEVAIKDPKSDEPVYVTLAAPLTGAFLLEMRIRSAANWCQVPISCNLHKTYVDSDGVVKNPIITMGPLCMQWSNELKKVVMQETPIMMPSESVRDTTSDPIRLGQIETSVIAKKKLLILLSELGLAESTEDFKKHCGGIQWVDDREGALVRLPPTNIFHDALWHDEVLTHLKLLWTPTLEIKHHIKNKYEVILPFKVICEVLAYAKTNTVALRRVMPGQELSISFTPVDLSKILKSNNRTVKIGNTGGGEAKAAVEVSFVYCTPTSFHELATTLETAAATASSY